MTDLRETVAKAIVKSIGYDAWEVYLDEADAAIAAARPIIEREVVERLLVAMEGRMCPNCDEYNNWVEAWREFFEKHLAEVES